MNCESDLNFKNCFGILTTFYYHPTLGSFMIRRIFKKVDFYYLTIKHFSKFKGPSGYSQAEANFLTKCLIFTH